MSANGQPKEMETMKPGKPLQPDEFRHHAKEQPQEIDLRGTSNVLKMGSLEIEAHADRLIVVRDEFRSGYECATCVGKGRVTCNNCNGTGMSVVAANARCSRCKGERFILCPECEGKQVMEGGIVVPDTSKREVTTGTIVSIGPEVTKFKRGDSILFTSFTGHELDLNAYELDGTEVKVAIVIMRESEPLAKVSGHLELRRVKRSSAVATAM